MLVALAGLVVGILLADCLRPALWVVAIGFVVCCGVACYRRQTVWLMIIMAGAFALVLRREAEEIPVGRQQMQIEILSLAHDYPSKQDYNARIVALHNGEKRQRKSLDIRVISSPALNLRAGDRVVVDTRLWGYDEQTSYGGYMLRVGKMGRIYLDTTNILQRTRGKEALGVRLRSEAMRRIEMLALTPAVESIVAAMSVGERSALTQEQRQSYVRSGAAHLLAVSGLHVGFLFVVVNLLLTPLAALRHGQLLRMFLAVVVIWIYAMMVGFSPSVVRAAAMFSIVQLMVALASRSDYLNTLCFAAFMMLVWDARMIYDAGFLLSVLAVVAIVEWAVPAWRWSMPKSDRMEHNTLWRRALRRAYGWFVSTVVVSFVASLATMPLSSYLFGEVSLWSVVVGGVMVAMSAVVVSVAMVWVVMPVAALGGVVGWVLEHTVALMNGVAQWCASSNIMSYQISISLCSCLLLYIAFALMTLALWSLPSGEK